MFNTVKFGNQIAEKRREAGLTQEELVGRVGDDKISVSTLKRIESGQGHIDMLRVIGICKELGCELQDLLGENDLKQALIKWFADECDKDEVEDRLYLQRLFYPEPMKSYYYENRPIKTMMQLLIYLPLMDDVQVLHALRCIEGDIFNRESYVLDKLWNLYDRIPDSRAKRYADFAAGKCTYDYFVDYYTSELTDADKLWLDPKQSEEMLTCHDEYVALIEKKKTKAEAAAVLQK